MLRPSCWTKPSPQHGGRPAKCLARVGRKVFQQDEIEGSLLYIAHDPIDARLVEAGESLRMLCEQRSASIRLEREPDDFEGEVARTGLELRA